MSKVSAGTVIENSQWKIKIYAPPKEHPPAHVHVVSKNNRAEVKISLTSLEVLGNTSLSRKAVRDIIKNIKAVAKKKGVPFSGLMNDVLRCVKLT